MNRIMSALALGLLTLTMVGTPSLAADTTACPRGNDCPNCPGCPSVQDDQSKGSQGQNGQCKRERKRDGTGNGPRQDRKRDGSCQQR